MWGATVTSDSTFILSKLSRKGKVLRTQLKALTRNNYGISWLDCYTLCVNKNSKIVCGRTLHIHYKGKGKAFPLQARCGPEGG